MVILTFHLLTISQIPVQLLDNYFLVNGLLSEMLRKSPKERLNAD